jgi:hypothetical protein
MSATAPEVSLRRQFRRSKRLGLSFPVCVRGKNAFGEPFDEFTEVVSVNAHGAQLALAASVNKGQTIRVENRSNGKECEFRVVYVGPARQGKWRVGIEFVDGPSNLWGVHFPQIRPNE